MAITAAPPARSASRPAAAPDSDRRLRRVLVGGAVDPPWVRPALLVLLVATGALYLWGLGRSGYANTFYSGAVQAGTRSWKAFFFGSSDAASSITVDKPPGALWVMELSARAFGLNHWSVLVPQALEGVGAVGALYATLRRWIPAGAALLGGAVLALTPAATLMFRFNNPDALLVLLLTLGAYATVRAVESGRTGWLVLAGTLVGTAFLAKMLQAFIVVPAFGATYLLAGPPRLRRRLVQLGIAGAAMLVAAGWWVAAVQLTPAADRPYIGGSQGNSLLNLIFGYNGLGRLTGNESGSVGGGPTGTGGRWGLTGLTRMFNADFGTQGSWLLPACALLVTAGLAWTLRRPRTDRVRAGLVLWGGWTLVTAAVFSLGQGIIHPYYTVALAPGVGGATAVGAALLWSRRSRWEARAGLAASIALTTWWAWALLGRDATWHPGLRTAVVVAGAVSVMGLIGWVPGIKRAGTVLAGFALLGAVAGLIAPGAYSLQTASTPHAGAIPSAGPARPGSGSGARAGGRGRGGAPGQKFGAGSFGAGRSGAGRSGPGAPPGGRFAFGPPPGGRQGFPGLPGGTTGRPLGGLLGGATVSRSVASALSVGASRYTWVAATVGSEQAASYQLATGDPVMPIGGFNGTDPSPTLAQFEGDVARGRIHWFLPGGGFGGVGGAGSGTRSFAMAITSWVEGHFVQTSVGGVSAYDLTGARS